MEIAAYASQSQRLRHFIVNALVFAACYQTANYLAQQNDITRSVKIWLDADIPFLAWMIVPYLCSGLFFVGSFVKIQGLGELRAYSQRLLLATLIAAVFFVLCPLRFNSVRPDIENPVFNSLFAWLGVFDRPYNQLPSLHVAYCWIFWQSLRHTLNTTLSKVVLGLSLFLIAISTLFTYQHHVMDVLAGLLLGVIVTRWIRSPQLKIAVAFYYAVAAAISIVLLVMAWRMYWGAYLAMSFLLVSIAYYREHRHFLHKTAGQHSLITWIFYAPYLLGYRLTWWLVQYRERHHPAFQLFAKQLWVGRRLTAKQAKNLPENCVVIDLSPELSELHASRGKDYYHYPLLDLIHPDDVVVNEIVMNIHEHIANGRNIYLHCAMGYQRSIMIAEHSMKNTYK